MPKFQHQRTGRVVEAEGARAEAYYRDPRRWVVLGDSAPEDDEPETDPIGEVPHGTIAEILAWAGNDEARKEAALYAERQGKARKTLMDQLS
jgi:hypothetical protein